MSLAGEVLEQFDVAARALLVNGSDYLVTRGHLRVLRRTVALLAIDQVRDRLACLEDVLLAERDRELRVRLVGVWWPL